MHSMMDFPYIDEQVPDESSQQRALPVCRAPQRLHSWYSESSEDAAVGRGPFADEISVNNLLDEAGSWSACEEEEAGQPDWPVPSQPDSDPVSTVSDAVPVHNGLGQAPDSGYSDQSSAQTQECDTPCHGRSAAPTRPAPERELPSLLQDVLAAVGPPSYVGDVRVTGSSDVVIGNVIKCGSSGL
ncbi:uncharacterized protein LOC119094015 [Pollicipes pollicipes]|uniref:uncharacterized protein LOC119094015 n=1 Tax=Pollicipes pollicipes TaxID=41117 RepID=UPI00188579FD|nr:uncharacterized protein LOC119094015 [Pollicipes pollicipes]